MMRGIFLLVICSLAWGQDTEPDADEDMGFPLTEEQLALCGPTGYFADPDDCCWFVQCDYEPFNVGHRVACMGGSVWNSEKCSCEEPNANNPCDPATCDVPEFVPTPCPTAGLRDDQCCIDGLVVTILNETSYYVDSETILGNQTCPYELLFNAVDCCCDSTTFTAPPPMCDHYTFDQLPFADEGVIASGAALLTPGADAGGGATAGSASFSAGAAAGAASAKLHRFSNVDFSNGFATAFWIMAEGSGSSVLFHNGDEGGQGASISLELLQTSGGGFAISGGVSSETDGVADFYQTTGWSAGSWHHVCMSYQDGQLTYSLDSEPPVTVNEADELDDESVLEIFKSAANDAAVAADSATENVRRRLQNVGADDPGFSELQGVLDCVEQIKADLEDNKEYLDDVQRGLDDFRKVRRRFRKAFNRFKRPKRRNDENRDELQDLLERARSAFELLREKVTAICDSLDKVCDILGNKEILKQLDAGSKKTLKRLKRKLKRLKGKFEDDSGDGKFSLKSIDKTFEETDRIISDYDDSQRTGRKKRQTDDDDGDEEEELDTDIIQSKYPFTIGEDFNGAIDELFVCDFPITEEQMDAIRTQNENPIMPMMK
ncbi:unnamed protein product [Owenia fusiformis]|uniref:Uncharacterized protein n=1 Tax=Owenia fusiformis TaxID=6347 RepID=A0A8J1U9K0_OWEFU|nr:unnamed protein product [Owenia fusiformis]